MSKRSSTIISLDSLSSRSYLGGAIDLRCVTLSTTQREAGELPRIRSGLAGTVRLIARGRGGPDAPGSTGAQDARLPIHLGHVDPCDHRPKMTKGPAGGPTCNPPLAFRL